jgi:hypothetical protein
MSEIGFLIEAAGDGRRWRIRVIKAGLSINNAFYSDKVLREAAPLFEGARVFVKGDLEHLSGLGKDFRNLIGRLVKPSFVEGASPDTGEIQSELELIEPEGPIASKLREAWQRGMGDLFGFSIDALGRGDRGRIKDRQALITTSIDKVKSVDLIVEPAAAGAVINLIEAQKGASDMDHLTPQLVADTVKASGLPQAAQDRLIRDYDAPSQVTEAELREAIQYERGYIARFTESGHVRGLGEFSRDLPGRDQASKIDDMLDAFFDPEHKDHRAARSIRSIYREATGDEGFTGQVARCDPIRLRESLMSTSFPSILGDGITRRMIALYSRADIYDVWRRIANVVPVGDFRTNERVRFGGYGNLPIVNEGQAYLALTSPTDEKATYTIAKRGGTEDVTLEMIANDDVGAIRQIPMRLTMAAKRTLAQSVLDLVRANPTIYDGLALFHATHGNLGSAALDATSLAAGRLAMMKQAELNSAARLGIGPRSLLVPLDAEEAAVNLFNRNTNNDKTFVQNMTLDVLPVWYWTDTNDWALAASPSEMPSIEVGFFGGREEPEVFIQDAPTVGSMFSHDKTTYKLRHIFGAVVTEYRGLYKSVV